MILTEQLRKELSEILREDFGLNISEKEAFEIGQKMIDFFEVLIKSEYEKNHKKD